MIFVSTSHPFLYRPVFHLLSISTGGICHNFEVVLVDFGERPALASPPGSSWIPGLQIPAVDPMLFQKLGCHDPHAAVLHVDAPQPT